MYCHSPAVFHRENLALPLVPEYGYGWRKEAMGVVMDGFHEALREMWYVGNTLLREAACLEETEMVGVLLNVIRR
jgi:hypothetical protein